MSDLVGNPEDRFSRVAAHYTKVSLSFLPLQIDTGSTLVAVQHYLASS